MGMEIAKLISWEWEWLDGKMGGNENSTFSDFQSEEQKYPVSDAIH